MSFDVPEFDLYGTLGVATDATSAEIEAAFRAAAKRDHPDLASGSNVATARMQRLNVARDWLTSVDRRERYDRARGVGGRLVDVPTIEPLGEWPIPGTRPTAPADRMDLVPVIAMIAFMILLGTVLIGIGSSLLTVTAFALALLILVLAGSLSLLRALR